MDHREAPIDFVGHVLEVRRDVIAHVNWVMPKPATVLCDVGYSRGVKGPERIFIESLDPFGQADFDAVGEQVVLPKQVLLLDALKKRRVIRFSY
jgi:hypothetical protein